MPIYEYRCNNCGNEFEELLLGRDPEPEKCPKCQSDAIKKKISNTSFTLTGNGWYVTDYGGYNPGAVPTGEGSQDEGKSGESAASTEAGDSEKSSSNSTSEKPTASKEKSNSETPKTSSSDA